MKKGTTITTIMLLLLALVLAVGAAPVIGDSATGQSATASSPGLSASSDYWRYGVSEYIPPNGAAPSTYASDLYAGGVRWYHNWHFNPTPGFSSFTYYPQALREGSNDGCYMTGAVADGAIITTRINANTYANGTTWLIGNEVGASYNSSSLQNYTPDQYAIIYNRCYNLLKGISPASNAIANRNFQIAPGGILPLSTGYNFTPPAGQPANGLNWFRAVRTAYQTRFGTAMPVDVYNIHLYEDPSAQGYTRILQDVRDFRTAMATEWNASNKPLIVSEMGVIKDVSWQSSVDLMNNLLDVLNSEVSSTIGLSSDGDKLVQKWAWFSMVNPAFSPSAYNYTALYTGSGVNRTALGNAYAAKAQAGPTNTPGPSNTPTRTSTRTVTPTPTNTRVIVPYEAFINAGGPQFTDSSNFVWVADRAYTTANQYGYIAGNEAPHSYTNAVPIAGTEDDTLYQSERYWIYSGGGYRFDVPNGQYQVDMKFAEVYRTGPNQRVFDVLIEGVAVTSNLDIYARAGGKTALDLSYTVTVSDGKLDIGFTPRVDTAKVNAIHIMPLGPQNTATATASPTRTGTSTRTNTPMNTSTRTSTPTITQTPTRTQTPSRTATRTITPTPTETPTGPAYEARINCGGANYTDGLGNLWTADSGYVGGFVPAPSAFDIINTSDDPLFQIDHRWYGSANPAYVFAVPNGQYEVTLRFAETDLSSANARLFDLAIEGVTVLNDFDIFAAAGGWKLAVDRTFSVTVSDGQLTISVTSILAKPKINAIHIVSIGATALPTTTATNTAVTASTATATATRTATVAATATATPTTAALYVKRVNSGGENYTDGLGNLWTADEGYVGGFVPAPSAFDIINTSDDPLFQIDHRWYGSANPAYVFAVPNGQYEVTLRFAETDLSSANARLFDLAIEGVTVLNDFDIFAAAGGWKLAVDRTFSVTVSDGQLTIGVTSIKAKPKINTITIRQVS